MTQKWSRMGSIGQKVAKESPLIAKEEHFLGKRGVLWGLRVYLRGGEKSFGRYTLKRTLPSESNLILVLEV